MAQTIVIQVTDERYGVSHWDPEESGSDKALMTHKHFSTAKELIRYLAELFDEPVPVFLGRQAAIVDLGDT